MKIGQGEEVHGRLPCSPKCLVEAAMAATLMLVQATSINSSQICSSAAAHLDSGDGGLAQGAAGLAQEAGELLHAGPQRGPQGQGQGRLGYLLDRLHGRQAGDVVVQPLQQQLRTPHMLSGPAAAGVEV